MSELIQANEPRCLADTFKPVDPEVWEHLSRLSLPTLQQLLAREERRRQQPVRPFHSGSQFADWQASNCGRCKREENADRNKPPTCPILYALSLACIGSGYVPLEIAERAGWKQGEWPYTWPCTEVEWTEAWKAEVLARQNGKEAAREVWTIRLG